MGLIYGQTTNADPTGSDILLRFPRVKADLWNPWPYSKTYGIRQIKFEAGVRTPDTPTLSEALTALWTPDSEWKINGSQGYFVKLTGIPGHGDLEATFLVDYQYGSFSVHKSISLAAEILLDMPIPDDVYVVSIDLTTLTWKVVNPASKLTRVEVSLASGDDVCRATAEPHEAFDGITPPSQIFCLFGRQQTDRIQGSILFYLADGRTISWSGNGRDLRRTNSNIKLSDSDWSGR